MDKTTLTVSVATFLLLLLLILWIKVQRSKRIQPKYKRGITMGLILLFALVVLYTRAYTENEYYTDIFQLGIMISVAVIMLAFVAPFAYYSRETMPFTSMPTDTHHTLLPRLNYGKLFDIKKIGSKVGFLVFAALCVYCGVYSGTVYD